MSNEFNISLSVVSSHPNLPSQPPLSSDRSCLFIAMHRPSRNLIGEDNPTKYAAFVAPRRRRCATTMGQQRGNAHQQAKTMSYQQQIPPACPGPCTASPSPNLPDVPGRRQNADPPGCASPPDSGAVPASLRVQVCRRPLSGCRLRCLRRCQPISGSR